MAPLIVNAASAWAMAGIIWLVQLVVYPTFRHVPDDGWRAAHDLESTRISVLVGPLMLAELVTSVLLVAGAVPAGVPGWEPWAALAATAVALAMTGAVHSPDHGRLGDGPDPRIVDRLISLGWIRTAAWTAHAALVVAMLAAA